MQPRGGYENPGASSNYRSAILWFNSICCINNLIKGKGKGMMQPCGGFNPIVPRRYVDALGGLVLQSRDGDSAIFGDGRQRMLHC